MPLTLHAPRALLPEGWASDVRVSLDQGGRIATVERGAAARPGDAVLAGQVLLPALPNLHSHTFQRAMAGLTEYRSGPASDDFWSWRALMYRFLDRMTPEEIGAVALLAFAEMLEGGFASVCEFHYLHNAPGGAAYADPAELSARIVAAAGAAGIGLTLLPVHYMQGGVDGRPLQGGQLRFRTDRDHFARILDGAGAVLPGAGADAVLGVAPHSIRAARPEEIAWAATLLPSGPVHIHAAEQVAEVEQVQAAHGARPVALLLDRLGADARWCLIHATQMLPEETAALAASGAVAGLCPVTESNLGDGIFPARAYLPAGGAFGIGTDSNILIDAGGELRTLEYSQRLRDRARVVLTDGARSVGRTLGEGAAAGGARAAGRETGAIAPGLWADLLTLDEADPAFPGDALLDAALFAAPRLAVRTLWSAGREVVREGRAVVREAAEAGFRTALRRLLAA